MHWQCNIPDNQLAAFELFAELTLQLASTTRLDQIGDVVFHHIGRLGFGGFWLAVLDEKTRTLLTVKGGFDGVDVSHKLAVVETRDMRQPIGPSFRERRMINITDPSSVGVIEDSDDPRQPKKWKVHRAIYPHLRDRPFAVGPLLNSHHQPVGAIGVATYRGSPPIPDEVLSEGALPAVMDHLGLAIERVLRHEQLKAKLAEAQQEAADIAWLQVIRKTAVETAHDLNNFCTIALFATGVGLRSPAHAFETLPRIELANRKMRDLVASLQRILRGSPGDAEVADLRQAVEAILFIVKPIQRERSIEVDVDLPAVPPVRCDPVRLHQVILNLLVNAHDALGDVPTERRRIEIRLHHHGDEVRLTIADSGPGIAPAVLDKLFQPGGTTKTGDHHGVGLAASRATLQQFDGTLEGRNRSTGGAVFEVTLQAASCTRGVAPGAVEEPAHAQAPQAVHQARAAKILAIDDDDDIVLYIHDYLELRGYDVVTATDSTKAVEAAKSYDFDLVLCDLGMPKQRGVDVCQLIRDTGFGGKLVLMTGRDTHALKPEQLPAQCDLLLKKPFGGPELVYAIKSLLGPQAPPTRGPSPPAQ